MCLNGNVQFCSWVLTPDTRWDDAFGRQLRYSNKAERRSGMLNVTEALSTLSHREGLLAKWNAVVVVEMVQKGF